MNLLTTMTRGGQEPVDPRFLERPRLAEGVQVHAPAAEGEPWILQLGEGGYFRVAEDFVRAVRCLDGQRTAPEVATMLGGQWTSGAVGQVVTRLSDAKLLDVGRPPRRRARLRYVPPLTVQYTVLDPSRLLRLIAPLARAAMSQPAALAGAAVGFAGALALVLQADSITLALGSPLPVSTYLAVLGAIFVSTILHEMSHGAVLARYGGRPTRMGFMLFYLSPAFFCDVSDGWRLPKRVQRVQVALAGIAMQLLLAAITAAFALPLRAGEIKTACLAFTVVTLVAALLNLLPFVKFDGYIALMSHLDEPYLRERAISDARSWAAFRLFGAARRRELSHRGWAVPYGFACLLFPIYLVVNAMTLWLDLLAIGGVVGRWLMLVGVAVLLSLPLRAVYRLVRESLAAGARPWRIALSTAAAVALVAISLIVVKVPWVVQGGWVADGGAVTLIVPVGESGGAVAEAASVDLLDGGLVLSHVVGSGTVASSGSEGKAPLGAVIPVRDMDLQVPATLYALTVTAGSRPDGFGPARVRAGELSLGSWLMTKYVTPILPGRN